MRRLLVGCCAAVVFFALFVASAGAVNVIESQEPSGVPETPEAGWQAGVCTEDPGGKAVVEEEEQTGKPSPVRCSAETPQLFFKQAAGHPGAAFTQILTRHQIVQGFGGPAREPFETAKTLLVDLPAGLSVNAQATPQCELEINAEGEEAIPALGCPEDTQIGGSEVAAFAEIPGLGGLDARFQEPFPVYNIKPRTGEPARFAFSIAGLSTVILNAGVAWQSDYHEYFTIHIPEISLLPGSKLITDRLTFDGTTGQEGEGGAFLTNPSSCEDAEVEPFRRGYATTLHADSHEEEAPDDEYDAFEPVFPPASFVNGSQEVVSYLPKGAKPEGCGAVPFEPTAQTAPGTNSTDSPAPATIEVKVPFEPHADVYQSNVKTVNLSLPQGLGLNPAAAPGLGTCTEAQFGEGTRASIECPADSRLGTVELETPVLPAGSLKGSAYLAAPEGNDPESGKLYRLFLDASSEARGVSVRLAAGISANKTTGRLTAKIEGAPQLPFTSFAVSLDGKAVSPLTSPSTCGPNVTNHDFQAYSGSPDQGTTEPGFQLASSPGGGNCAKTGAERPFSPGFSAAPATGKAKASTNYTLAVQRKDGEQELKGIDVTLPPGTTARLKGVAYCADSAIAAATQSTGRAEIAAPSCPSSSFIGTAQIEAGAGSNPLKLSGNAYLGGPYKGAPLSMAIVTPAVAGPFDLGTVVVRAAIFVEPESGQIHVVSDPIPDVVGGAKIDLRSLSIDLSRSYFVRNGTSCKAASVNGSLAGGGDDPSNPSAFTSKQVSVGSWIEGCKALEFKPRLQLTLSGATKRASNPHLKAVLNARSAKDADIASLSVGLPHALFLDQSSLGTVCTRPQFAANQCPEKSVYGTVRAWSPLLDQPLAGKVYLRSSDNKLPDLVAHLEGQVDIDLVGRIDNHEGGIRTSFEGVPDLPVSKLELNLPGGKHGLLEASRDLCQAPVKAKVLAEGHNSRKADLSRAVTAAGCKPKKM
jgi:hypothetical protein